ncbi:MAG TPA: hypothetical protein VKU41_11405 [Polyangiaceae bacterium]|nr:hypothetical protein [Polyangiaceae bacterium]
MTTSEPTATARGRRRPRSANDPAESAEPEALLLAKVAYAAHQARSRVTHELDEHPTAVLAAVAGVSFVAGAVLGSRLGRAILVAVVPAGMSYAMRRGVGKDVREWLADALGADRESGAR